MVRNFSLIFGKKEDLSEHIKPDKPLVNALRVYKQKNPLVQHYLHTNSNTAATVEKKLGLIGISPDFFEKIITSVDVGRNKPDKKMFQVLIDLVKKKPRNILYVGDREKTDIVPAKKMGMQAAIITTDISKAQNSVADIVAGSAQELLELIS